MNGSDSLVHHTVGGGTPSTSQVMSMVKPEYVVYDLGSLTIFAGTDTRISSFESQNFVCSFVIFQKSEKLDFFLARSGQFFQPSVIMMCTDIMILIENSYMYMQLLSSS